MEKENISLLTRILRFRIELESSEPTIWREIDVPSSYSFWDLHVAIQDAMRTYLKNQSTPTGSTLQGALGVAVRAWALGSLSQSHDDENAEASEKPNTDDSNESFSEEQILDHLKTVLTEKTLECAILERHGLGSSKYRSVDQQELSSLLPMLNPTTN